MAKQTTYDMTAGDPVTRAYQLTIDGTAITTGATVQARVLDTASPDEVSTELIATKAVVWNPTGGAAGTGAWEVSFTGTETRVFRETPADGLSKLRYKTAVVEVQIGAPYNLTRYDHISIGKGTID
ncbi:MAG: hypothetical protein AAFN18_12010 [Cyanobacteria bacterium J06554_6]